MSEKNMEMILTINGQDDASAMLKGIVAELEKIKKLGASLGSSFKTPFTAAAFKPITSATLSMTKLVEQIEAATVAMGRLDAAAAKFKSPRMAGFLPQTAGRHVRPRIAPSPVQHPRPGRSLGTAAREMRTGIRSAGGHTHLGSPAVAALVGTTTAVVALRKSIDAAVSIDTATTKMSMFGGLSAKDAQDIRAQALRTSIDTGMAPEHIINSIQESLRAGLSKPLALAVGDVVPKVAASLGESAETIGNTFGEAVQQLSGMSEGKFGPDDVRRFGNEYAGLANFGGNTAEKSKQFLDSGGLGRGRELGWDPTDTLAVAAAANAKGARTGQATSRMLGQISQSLPKMHDIYDRALRAKNQTQMDRDIVAAPNLLGYRNIDDMQASIKSGAGGFFKFVESLSKLEADQRKRILEGFKIPESAGAVLGELGASPGTGQKFLDKGRELAGQGSGQDYMTSQFSEWSKSLQQIINQIHASFEAIKAELGDALKSDVLAPFRDFFTDFAKSLLNGGLREQFHRDILAFVNGLGFEDAAKAFQAMRASIVDPEFAGFLKGLGAGIADVIAAFKSMGSALGLLGGSGGAEALGRLTAELFGFGLACRAMAPVVGTLTVAAEVFKALSAAGLLTGLAAFGTEIKALTALPFAAAAEGLAALLGPLAAMIGLAGVASNKGMLQAPGGFDGKSILKFLDPGLADRVYGKDDIQKQSFTGSGYAGLIHKASFDDTAAGRATMDTAATVRDLLSAVQAGGLMGSVQPSDYGLGVTKASYSPGSVRFGTGGGGSSMLPTSVTGMAASGASMRGHIGGAIKVGDQSFRFGSGGGGHASIPFGDFAITPSAIGRWGAAHGAIGLAGGRIWDQTLGRDRLGIELHAGHSKALLSAGCLAIDPEQWPAAKRAILDMVRKNGGASLHVGPEGASITPGVSTIARRHGHVHNGDVIHNFHIHDATDPSAVGAAVKNHLDQHMGYRTSDVGVDL